jgi:primosomal protein N' (replication factor Y) (superfamily II helicase)
MPTMLAAVGRGPTLVVVPEHDTVALLATRLRRAGVSVAIVPDDWAAAAGGVDVVIGTRTAAWAPCPDLAAAVVVDEHDEACRTSGLRHGTHATSLPNGAGAPACRSCSCRRCPR